MNTEFLDRLLNAVGPSGFEVEPARVWRTEAESFASVQTDVHGNSVAMLDTGLNSGPEAGAHPEPGLRVMMAGHIDEIGLQITHIDEKGFIFIAGIGGWDPQVVVGQRVTIMGRDGLVPGVVGKKAIHLIKTEERSKAAEMEGLWVDVGVSDRDQAVELGLRVGDPMVIDTNVVRLAGDRIASRAIDNRIGAFVVLEALRLLADEEISACPMAVATVQEEIGLSSGGGARSSAFALEPDVALVVDVTFSTDVPDIEKKEHGEHNLGGGPVLTRGSSVHGGVFDRLAEVADQEGISYTLQAAPKFTSTDADSIFLTRTGVPTGLISVPNRYMHSPNEVVSLSDLESTAKLLAAFVRSLTEDTDFTPR